MRFTWEFGRGTQDFEVPDHLYLGTVEGEAVEPLPDLGEALREALARPVASPPLEELGRPRIDVTVRVSGLLRDNFTDAMHLLDDAVQAVAALPEDPERNFVRKHSLEDLELDAGESAEEQWRRATLRIFSAKPGTYLPGVNLAVYASAWKDEKDLADIFVTWNGYAYGRNTQGEPRHDQLANRLKTVEVTFNKVISDEHDLFGCCSYFGSHGGLTAAARHL
jgi:cobaltochelatase CobN